VRAVLLAVVAGCAYRAGSFESWGHDFAGRQTTVGCLDLAIEPRLETASGPVLAYDFGNRCDRPVVLDLGSTSVIAKTGGGNLAMVPIDPRHEIRALPLDARSVGAEAIAYRIDPPAAGVTAVCVDAASVVGDTPPDWQCFDRITRP